MKKVIISGGGTGGHIFPAVAIADELKRQFPSIDILFVGAEGKMEMEKVPQAGYKIIGLPIVGFQRKLTLKNFVLPFKIIKSLLIARKTIKNFNPDIVIGVGGYASGPTLKMAALLGIPTLVQEQNSFAGKTNMLLAKKANKLCVAYEGMEKFFPKDKIVLTGNPVRFEVTQINGKRNEAFQFYQLDESKPTILIIGGSLGAKTLNESIIGGLTKFQEKGIQVLWQCGKLYYDDLSARLKDKNLQGVHLTQFISRMDLAYALADTIISRAGAISVSELCLVHKPVILVPSPNVAEDHQTHNAMALVNKNAALLVKDIEAREKLVSEAILLVEDVEKQKTLAENIAQLGKPNATKDIVSEIVKIADK
ncbi:MAG: undecaprenyldiphospho-muramoylpentapeptide beta-N-acetylglucosaminyltransferase [Crocinitomicaceae bacterium]|nr:undecaprenyldiphospho-muramoylpentapeptide beta-N-acetylglucosaminyltransferase [Crocinitomicaceae bacterium]